MNYKEVIESRYNRQNWQLLLHDIFGSKIKFWNTPSVVTTSSPFAKQALWLGTITLSDEQTIAVYEVELSESVDIERNRRGIRDMLLTAWRNNGNAGAFMFCYRKNESVLRFSYVSESWKFADDGSYQKESTDTRRFTYLLGEGHRSRTAIQQFEKLRDSQLSLKDLTKAFSVDAVSDMFFDGYKKQYENIIFYITGKRMVKVANKWEERLEGQPCQYIMRQFSHFPNPEKSIRDYVKKLMGRLVFLQFLQKKGWLGVGVHDEWGNGDPEFIQNLFASCNDKDHFIDKVLEPLFNDLNTEEGKKLPHYRTPYLNGGLFEREAADETDFPLPAQYMQSLLDFFASYNFTIDENDPDDAEVGVDPEMLGRIFENLLEDNKDKGAFYTPKEIVSYMCRESLIAYLQTGIQDEVTKEAIRLFVTTHQIQEHLPENIDQLLKDVKICDPAIGSGAFPMGLLKELFLCRTALEGISQHQAAEIKKHIIQQNVYGVDIERGAVDIARLRFWLSLIVDEETPQALPNLDFKIMQGNSLLEQYKSVVLSTMTEKKADDTGMLTIFEDMVDIHRRELREMLAQYYDCTDHNAKQTLRARIIDNVKQQLQEQHINMDFGDLDLSGNSQFFLWHIWFHDVFSKGGFDIVIGNPPYVFARNSEEKGMSQEDKELYYKKFILAKYQINLYHLFVEQGVNLLNEKGTFAYIIPNNWMTINTNRDFRKYILSKSNIIITNFNKKVFETAEVDSSILIFKNSSGNSFVMLNETLRVDEIETISKTSKERLLSNKDYIINIDLYKSNEFIHVLNKIEETSCTLSSLSEVKAGLKAYEVGKGNPAQTAEMKKGRVYHSLRQLDDSYYPYIDGNDVKRYVLTWERKEYLKYGDNLAAPRKNWALYSSPRILVRQIPSKPPYCINACFIDKIVLNDMNSMNIIDIKCNPYYLLAIINSRPISFWFAHKFGKLQRGLFPQFKINELASFPIPSCSKEQEKQLAELANKIMVAKEADFNADTIALETEIDRLVYQLYGLTEDEIAVIEGT
jgi:type I restriction-modification system DNA methylase subunit